MFSLTFILVFLSIESMTAHPNLEKIITVNYPLFLLVVFWGILLKIFILRKGAKSIWTLFITLIIISIFETVFMISSIYLVFNFLLISLPLVYVEILLIEYVMGILIHLFLLIFKFPEYRRNLFKLSRKAGGLAIIYPIIFSIFYLILYIIKLY